VNVIAEELQTIRKIIKNYYTVMTTSMPLVLLPYIVSTTLACLSGFRYHPINAVQAKKNYDEYISDYYYDYDYKEISSPSKDIVVAEEEKGSTGSTNRLQNATNCGRKGEISANFHVVGGGFAREGELPWHVSMLRAHEGWHGCSATLLSCDPPVIITAAHCVEKTRPSDLKLGFGSYQLSAGRPSPMAVNEQRLTVGEIITHPEYAAYVARFGKCKGKGCTDKRRFLFNALNVSIYENDIAILKIESPELLICEERKIWPACLPNGNFGYGGWGRTILSGWGRVEEGGQWSRTLKRARLPIVSDAECTRNLFRFTNSLQDIPYFAFKINRKQLCAGKTTLTKKGGCQGDSGGEVPLLLRTRVTTVGLWLV